MKSIKIAKKYVSISSFDIDILIHTCKIIQFTIMKAGLTKVAQTICLTSLWAVNMVLKCVNLQVCSLYIESTGRQFKRKVYKHMQSFKNKAKKQHNVKQLLSWYKAGMGNFSSWQARFTEKSSSQARLKEKVLCRPQQF